MDKIRLPIDPDSPEDAKLNELVSMLIARFKGASAEPGGSVISGLNDILTASAFSSIPQGVRMEILFFFRKVLKSPDPSLSDSVIQDLMKRLLAMCAKEDATGKHEEKVHSLISYGRGFIRSRLRSGTILPEAQLKADIEALVAESPFSGSLDFFRKLSESEYLQKLKFQEVREWLNAYLREAETAKAQKQKNAPATIGMEAEANELAKRKEADLPRSETARVIPLITEAPATVNPNPDKVERLSMKPSRRNDFRESPEEETVGEGRALEPAREETIVEKAIFELEYDQLLDGLNPPRLEIGDVIYCVTTGNFVFEFIVKGKSNNSVKLEGVNGDLAGLPLSIGFEPIVLYKAIKFTNNTFVTKKINRLEVRKKSTLSRDTRKAGDTLIIHTVASEENEAEGQGDGEILCIGDSNGNFDAHISNLEMTEAFDEDGNWIEGKGPLVILGDILADRNPEGLLIMKDIWDRVAEAKKFQGDITVNWGNHDYFMAANMLGIRIKAPEAGEEDGRMDAFDVCLMSNQGLGLFELAQFTGDKKKIVDVNWMAMFASKRGDGVLYNKLKKRITDALPAMRQDPQGRRLLEQMCQMNLCKQIGNVVFFHTDPTNGILKLILDVGVDNLNTRTHEIMRRGLLKGEPFDPRDHFLFDTFLYTENRTFSNFINPFDPLISKDRKSFSKYFGALKNAWEGQAFAGYFGALKETQEGQGISEFFGEPEEAWEGQAFYEYKEANKHNWGNPTFMKYFGGLGDAEKERIFSDYIDFLEKIGEGESGLSRNLVHRLKKEKGIGQVAFGHSNLGQGNRKLKFEGVTFLNADQGAGKRKGQPIKTVSALSLDPKGVREPKTGTEYNIDIRKMEEEAKKGKT